MCTIGTVDLIYLPAALFSLMNHLLMIFLLIDLIIRNIHNAERELYHSALRDEKHVRLMA